METIRKKYTDELKREAVSLVLEHGYSYSAAGSSLDINPHCLPSGVRSLAARELFRRKAIPCTKNWWHLRQKTDVCAWSVKY